MSVRYRTPSCLDDYRSEAASGFMSKYLERIMLEEPTMKMHEITTAAAHRVSGRFGYTMTIHADHRAADNFVRLTHDNDDVRVLAVEEIGEGEVKLLVACATGEFRNSLQDAW
jgi:hypothetical protein